MDKSAVGEHVILEGDSVMNIPVLHVEEIELEEGAGLGGIDAEVSPVSG